MTDILKLAEAEDGEGLLIILGLIGYEEDERMWRPIKKYGIGVLLIFFSKTTGNAPKDPGSIASVAPVRNLATMRNFISLGPVLFVDGRFGITCVLRASLSALSIVSFSLS